MPGLYSHTTRSTGTVLTSAIYNNDHLNHITNHIPSQMDDHSPDVATMQTTADPGEQGTESLSTSLKDEIEQLRFAITESKGTTYWYESPGASLADLSGQSEGSVISGRMFT
jgi:hypothetical protein